jgi:Ca2+-binding EF-hand superfamily protein
VAKIGVAVDDADLADFFRYYDANNSNSLDYKEFTDIIFGKSTAPSSTASQRGRIDTQTPRATTADLSYRGIKK